MAQSGFTPVQLYRSTTAAAVPLAANLAAGELAINLTDEKLYFENASGVVKVLADSTYVGTVTSVAASGGTTGLTFSGSPITSSGTLTLSGTLAVANGGTGATTLTGVVKGNGTSAFTAGTVSLTSEVSGTLPVANGGTGVTSSTGTVAVVLSNSPTLVTPNLGTPSAATLTNATGLPLSTGVTGTLPVANGGTGVTTSTGTVAVVLSNSPTLVTPTLGAASATSIANGLGAVGTPSYTFTGNTNTGMWSPAADTIAFSEGGVEAMRIDSSGNVGIGTSAPSNLLHIARSSGNAIFRVQDTSSTSDTYYISDSNGTSITQTGALPVILKTTNAERMRIDSSGNVGIGTSSPGARLDARSASIADGTNGGIVNVYSTTAQAANVGGKLDLGGLYDGSNYLSFASIAGRKENSTSGNWSGYMQFSTREFGGAFAERMRITAAGDVGIGTSSPTYRLDIVSGDTTASVGYAMRLRSNATATAASLQFTNSGASAQNGLIRCTDTGETVIQADGASSLLAFRTNGSERMRIDSSGNVGIGTTSISYKLEVAGDVRIAGGGGDLRIQSATGTTSTGGDSQIYNDANNMIFTTGTTTAERMRIGSSGDVGIGTSSPSSRLEVNASSGSTQVAYFINNSAGSTLAGIAASIESGGNNTNSFHFAGVTQTVALWYLYGNGTTSYTSDIRVKKNVTTTRDGYLEDVCKLRVVKYNWYNDSDETPRELGFIAQEVEQVFPGLVQDALHPTKDGEIHKVLKGSVMMPIMLKALQEASAKIDALTARVAQLEGN